MSQARSNRNEKSKARKNSLTKKERLARRRQALGRAMEALESRMLLSVSGFQPAVNYNTGVSPSAVAKGDFIGNGKTDLVIANQVGNNVSILMGNGDGTFNAPVNYAAGSGPRAVVVGDFNGDGKPDIAVVDAAGNDVSILINNGNGTFAAPVTYNVGNDPLAIVAGDFTGHGKIDLAVANYQDNTISVLAGNGNGTFAAQQVYSVSPSANVGTGPNAIVAGDFNGDGKLDLATSDAGGGASILLSDGHGGFGAANVFNAGTSPTGLVTGFFNGDANLDLAVVNATSDNVSVLLGAGDGTFGSATNYAVGADPLAITAGDFNNDGKTDLAVVNADSNNISVLYGVGDGTFGAATNKPVGGSPQAIVVGNFNGHGPIDVAVVNQADDNVSVLLDKFITVTGVAQNGFEGSSLAGVTVATFVDSEAGTVVGDYSATVNWGDGTAPTTGTITFGNGHYSVAGTHTYADEGVYTITATVQDTLGTTSSNTATAKIRDAALTSAGVNVSINEGAPFSGSIATFNDANAGAHAADFTAVIQWGDGTSGNGAVVSDGGGAFHVTASHTWKHKATLPVTIVISDIGTSKTTASATATIADAPLTPSAGTPVFVEGTSASQTIATFLDANPFGSAAEFSAMIHWGDGTPDSAATIVSNGTGYDVAATHTYVHSGNKSASVSITSVDGSVASQNVTVAVHNAAMTATAPNGQYVEAIPFSNAPVAHFTDANTGATVGDFTATIDWGDGTPLDSNTTIVVDQGNPGFFVQGDHNYLHGGNPTLTVTINGAGGTTLIRTSNSQVLNQTLSAYGPYLPEVNKVTPGELYRGVSGAFNTNNNAFLGVVSASGAGGVTYMAGNGDGTFSPAVNYAIGHGAISVAAADFNNDGKLDIVTANSGGGISIALGNGDGTFAAPTDLALLGDVHDVVVGDFNHDGNMDIATANYADGSVSVLMGNGDGTFAAPVRYAVGNNPYALTAVDLNGDGKKDLAVVNKGDGTVSVLLNNGNGTFASPVTYAVGSNPVSVKAGNLAGDGKIGLVVGNNGDNTVSVLKGNGDGTFQTAVTYSSGLGTQDLALVDLYNTGKPDILVADEGDGTVSILENKGDGTFAPQMKMPANHGTLGLVTGDFNGDGKIDLVANSFNTSIASVFISNATPIAATEGTAINANTVLMHFTDPNGAAVAADFPTVSIDWGDGHTSSGTVVANINGGFDVIGGHTYDHAGKKTVITTVTGAGGGVVTGATKVSIANAMQNPTGIAISPVEGSSYNGTVAHFSDANPNASASDFTASIVWGDGATTTGTVVANLGGGFDVNGIHTYAEEGAQNFTVTITALDNGTVSTGQTATISDAALHSTGVAVTATEGTALSGVKVATFTDDDPAGTATDYTATIHWGDGSSSAGTVTANLSGGFDVTGDHTYLHAGDHAVSAVITDTAGLATTTSNSTATVNNATVTATAGAFSSVETHGHSQIVANFSDLNAAAIGADFTATINWGDGVTADPGVITSDGLGGFNVTGTHTYARNGSKPVVVTINGAYGQVASAGFNAAVAIEPTVTATGLNATEGASFTGQVAHFTDSSGTAQASDFIATIQWGDGNTSTGIVTANLGGGFDVSGTNTYLEESAPTYTVTITSSAGTGGTGSNTGTATVADASLNSTGVNVTGVEGTAITAVKVATFTDNDPNGTATDYTAVIHWGDGTTSAGTVTANLSGGFDVTGDHTYLHAGDHAVSAVITDTAGLATTTSSSTATVDNAAMTAAGQDFAATEGTVFTGQTVGTFTDANASSSIGDFTATIHWGDGSAPTLGMITQTSPGHFSVASGHTYADAGNYAVTLNIAGLGGGTASAGSIARVANQTITVTGHPFSATEGLPMTNALVATFTDANASAVAGDFSAVISWSDGTTSAGTIAANNSNGFDVTGSHTYAHSGNKTATITIYGRGGQVLASDGADALTLNSNATFNNGGLQLANNQGSQHNTVWTTTPVSTSAFHTTFSFQLPSSSGDGFTFALQNSGVHAQGSAGSGLGYQGINSSVAVTFGFYPGVSQTGVYLNGVSPHSSPVDMAASGIDLHSGHVFDVTLNYDGSTLTETVTDETTQAVFTHAYTVNIAAALGASTGYVGFTGGTGGAKSIQNILNWNYESNGVSNTANGTVANQALTATAVNVSAIENTATGAVLVATFTDPNSLASASDFTATVNWGDGSPIDNAVVTANGSGGFNVTGPTHTYLHSGNKSMTVTITGAGGGTATATPTASVANEALNATGHNITVTEGVASGTVTVASFTDANPNASTGDFTATIDWGDGNVTQNATIVDNGGGNFDITGANTYLHAGTSPITVDITGNGGGTTNASATATINNAPLSHVDGTFTATEGASFSGVIGHFSDANAAAGASEFTASINWGDGTTTNTAPGDIVSDGSGGFFVHGTHTYAEEGAATVTTTITGNGGGSTTSTYTSTVADTALAMTGSNITAIEGTGFTGKLVANFTDADPNGATGDFTATINWGDGHSTAGTVTADGHGGWNVSGDYLYAVASNYVVTTTITDAGGATQQATSVSAVAHGTISATGVNVTAVEGTALPGSTLVAHFTDTNLSAVASNFTATIDWGDGSAPSSATVTANGGGFDVTGGHTYSHSTTDSILVSISGVGDSKTAGATATVNNNTITITSKVNTAVEGTAFIGNVVSFTDANAAAVKGDFTAMIDWNDETAPTVGTVNDKAGGGFYVAGTHTYTVPASYTPTVTITGGTGQTFTGQGVLAVADATLNPSAVTIHATEGASFSGTVGTFQDQNHGSVTGGFTATIDWGDGHTDTGTITANGTGAFTISGGHVWASAGNRNVVVTITDGGGASATISSTSIVGDATLAATGQPVAAVEGTPLSGALVATFTDANPLAVAGDFTATITWGDGSTSSGTVTAGDGDFSVTGDHTYVHAGSKAVSVVINDVGGATTSASSTATIANATLGITAGTVSGVEGQQIVASVANFTDANASAVATDFTATINWGDNATSVGAISDGADGGFDVLGAHIYSHAGPHMVTVTINGNGGGTVNTTITANVTNAALAGLGKTASVVENHALSNVLLASFTDANTHAVAADFTASINWNDGTANSAGTVVDTGSGTFNVTGTHTYLHSGNKAPIVTLTGIGGGSANATATVHVTNDTLSSTGPQEVTATEGVAFSSTTVAHFTDVNPNASASDFTATVDWGDGLAVDNTVQVVANNSGGFDVVGGRTYAHAGNPSITVTITGNGGGTTIATGTIQVANAALASTGKTLSVTEGAPLGGVIVAHFTDANGLAVAGDFTASIAWGDTTTSSGSVVTSLGGGFDVVADHSFAHSGDKSVAVTITGNGGGSTVANTTIHVTNATLTGTGKTASVVENHALTSALLANFTDSNAGATAADFTATINWNDGTSTTAGTVTDSLSGGFDVTGTHTYLHSGDKAPTITLHGAGGGSAIATGTVHVTNDTLIATGIQNLIEVEGVPFSNAPVAHFTDANPNAVAGDFTATIDWGDFLPVDTNTTIVANINGGFDVLGNRTYAHAGARPITTVITGNGGGTKTAVGNVIVHNAAMAATGKTINAIEGTALSNNTVVAHFTDANALAGAGDFLAAITWGDGSSGSGTIVSNINGGFDVVANHTYLHGGADTIGVTITGSGGGTASTTSPVHVGNTTITATALQNLTVTEGVPFSNAPVAHFTDANASAVAGDFTATIDWGDNTALDTSATVVANISGGFDVIGGHTYAHAGHTPFSVTITGHGGGTAPATGSANVQNAGLDGNANTLIATEGTAIAASTIVAHFRDANTLASAGDFAASIAWGDNTTTPGVIVANVGGGFDVTAGHTYSHSGDKSFVVTITGNGGGALALGGTAHVNNATLTSSASTLNATEGSPLAGSNGVVIAHFSDANAQASAGDFDASVNWGDGSAVDANTTIVANVSGGFDVVANHTYDHSGDKTFTVSVVGDGGGTTTPTGTAHVANATLTPSATPFTVTEGTAFTGQVVAHFTDANANAAAGDFTATIFWGDGSAVDTNTTIVANVGGGFDVVGGHTYAHSGDKTLAIHITGAGGTTVVTGNTAHVSNATLTPTGLPVTGIEGVAFTGVVATFTDANAAAIAGDFAASINWGDGSPNSVGIIAANNSGGFNITGTHTYALQGTKSIAATVTGNGGGTAVAHSTMTVNDSPLTSTGVTLANTVNVPLSNVVVASFVDPNLLDGASHFSAIITWENGATSAGTIVQTSPGHYNVTGSYTYTTTGAKAPSVFIQDGGGQITTANSTVNVAGAGFTASFTPFTATESVLFTGKLVHFASTIPGAVASGFTASIIWGDGSPNSAGTITASATGGFDVTGSHTWRYGGYKPVSVRVTNTSTSGYIIAGGNNYVGVKAMTALGASLSGKTGTQLAATIATFTDANTLAVVGDFTASINWGDGTTSLATVIKSGTTYSVLAWHTYTTAATYSVKTTISNVNGLTAIATTKIVIARSVASKPVVGGGHGKPPVHHHRPPAVGGGQGGSGTGASGSGAWTKPQQEGHGV